MFQLVFRGRSVLCWFSGVFAWVEFQCPFPGGQSQCELLLVGVGGFCSLQAFRPSLEDENKNCCTLISSPRAKRPWSPLFSNPSWTNILRFCVYQIPDSCGACLCHSSQEKAVCYCLSLLCRVPAWQLLHNHAAVCGLWWTMMSWKPLWSTLTHTGFPAPVLGNSACSGTPVLSVTLGIVRPHCPTKDSALLHHLSPFQSGTSLTGADF